MKLVLFRLCIVVVIAVLVTNVGVFARIFRNLDRSKTELVRSTKFVPKGKNKKKSFICMVRQGNLVRLAKYSCHYQRCVDPGEVTKKMCLLKPQTGPCRANLEMYFFNSSSLNCSTFTWGGCQGNGNRFDTEDECIDYCRTKRGDTEPRPNYCQLTFDYGYCFGDVKRYYYDPLYQVCKATIYSGCGGNKNNFYNIDQCVSACIWGKGRTTKKAAYKPAFKTVVIVDPPNTTPPRGRFQNLGNSTVGTFIRKYVNDSGIFYVTFRPRTTNVSDTSSAETTTVADEDKDNKVEDNASEAKD